MKRLHLTMCVVGIMLLLSGCTRHNEFCKYAEMFAGELAQEHSSFESLKMEIVEADDLKIKCYLAELCSETEEKAIYEDLVLLFCGEDFVNHYLASIDAGYTFDAPAVPIDSGNTTPAILLELYVGENKTNYGVQFTVPETVYSHGYEHITNIYYGFPGWELEYKGRE